jgi:hypothetical protein
MNTTTVLIVDRDLGFIFWLGKVLAKAGYLAVPAKGCESGAELVSRLDLRIDVLIVSNAFADAGVLADGLRHSQRYLKVIAVLGDGEEPVSAFSGSDTTQYRPSLQDEGSEMEWLKTIAGVSMHTHNGATARILPSKGARPS